MTKQTNIPVIIQATHYSPLFEGKSTVRIKGDTTVLGYLIERIRNRWPGKIILATSNQPEDDILAAEADRYGVSCVRASHRNLVARLWEAAKSEPYEHFVRAYGNYPLLDVGAMASMVMVHLEMDTDYSYNDHHKGVPWGMGCEVIAKRTLKYLLNQDLNSEQKEAGTLFIRQNDELFSVNRWTSQNGHPRIKLAFETRRDLLLLQDIIAHVSEPDAQSVIEFLSGHPALITSNLESAPREIGLEKLFLHPLKIDPLLRTAKDAPDLSYPISVELSLTNRCNLKCTYCSDSGLRERQGTNADLDTETLFQLFDDLKDGGAKGVVLEGGGEPTLHPDFADIVSYLASIELPVGLITNGTTRLPSDVLSLFEWIRVSVDASSAKEWKRLKGSDQFSKVLSNLREYASNCRTVGIGYVVTNCNMADIETLVFRVRQHGIAYIQFRPVIDAPHLALADPDLSYLGRYQTGNFSVLYEGMEENLPTGNSGLSCRVHSLTTVISGDGSVYLCGRLNIHPWMNPIGNIHQTTFREIWEGKQRKTQSNLVLDPEFCRAFCPQCRLNKFNVLLDRLERTRSQHFI